MTRPKGFAYCSAGSRSCSGCRAGLPSSTMACSKVREWCIEQNLGPHIAQNSALLKYSAGRDSSWYARARSGYRLRRNFSLPSNA